jgi:thymidylate synthase
MKTVLNEGQHVSPRGLGTLEIVPVAFTLANPRCRLITSQERRWSLPIALGEFLWHVAGSDDAAAISYYAKPWGEIATKGRILGSCYGNSIYRALGDGESQWTKVLNLIKHDSETRRAVFDFRLAPT